MNILFCYMYQSNNKMSCADGMVRSFKALGHNVSTCGPADKNFDGKLLSKHDIPLYDKANHPETYTYEEIINKHIEKYIYKPDLIIQTDPHFYLIGDKPKDIISAYWIMDVHRGPNVFRDMAIAGKFDYVFIAQKYYMPIFKSVGLNCIYLPWAYDDTKIYEHPEINIECDISFIGNTSLKEKEWFSDDTQYSRLYYDKELGLKYIKIINNIPNEKKFGIGWENRSMEYAERTEHLCRLSRDFNVRIYERCYDLVKYSKALSRGRLGFHHSLRRDITLKVFEIPAINRMLITDEIPNLNSIMTDGVNLKTFKNYYQPQFAGFDLDYEILKKIVDYYLKNKEERNEIAKNGMLQVKNNHTFKNRAQKILSSIKDNNGRNQ